MTIQQLSIKINAYMGRVVPYQEDFDPDVMPAYTFGDHEIGTYIYAYKCDLISLNPNSPEAREYMVNITSFLETHNV